jgi:hypothetical protein
MENLEEKRQDALRDIRILKIKLMNGNKLHGLSPRADYTECKHLFH